MNHYIEMVREWRVYLSVIGTFIVRHTIQVLCIYYYTGQSKTYVVNL